jgi:hypothetical protein
MENKSESLEELVYLGYLSEDLLPQGVGAYISPITMKVLLSASFKDGWIDGFGRKIQNDGKIIEGHFKRS